MPSPLRLARPRAARRAAALVLPSLALAAVLAAAGCVDTTAQQNTAQALLDLGDQLNGLRQDNAVLQQQVDSLASVVARQDTLLRRLAGMAGVPLTP